MKRVHFPGEPMRSFAPPNGSLGNMLSWMLAVVFPFVWQALVFAQLAVVGQTSVLPQVLSKDLAQEQGIEGTVFLVNGNQMPSPDRKPAPPKPAPATIYVYELTNIHQVTRQNHSSGYSSIATRKIAEKKTDTAGRFRIFLPPGRYSVFAKAGTSYFANGSDTDNNLAPVEVSPGKMTKIDSRIEGHRPAVY